MSPRHVTVQLIISLFSHVILAVLDLLTVRSMDWLGQEIFNGLNRGNNVKYICPDQQKKTLGFTPTKSYVYPQFYHVMSRCYWVRDSVVLLKDFAQNIIKKKNSPLKISSLLLVLQNQVAIFVALLVFCLKKFQ